MAGLPIRLRLLGTSTSPYTRKVRVLARAAGVDLDLWDTREEAGRALLARVAPLGKIPVLVGGAEDRFVLPDSSLIAAWLWDRCGAALREAGIDLDPARWDDRAIHVVVEGALDAAINRYYLLRDGSPDQGYVARQGERVTRALDWLDENVRPSRPCTAALLSLGCALDWMAFREVVAIERWPGLAAFRRDWTASGLGAGSEPG